MKKLLLLGGSAQQVIAIQTAKRLGYYTVLCDFLPDNPGQYEADKFFLVSTTDKEAVLAVAKEEAVDGVLAYASDPAAPTAAYVAEKLGLATNPYKSVEILCNKDKFRKFLSENGFNTPKAGGYSSVEEAIEDIGKYKLPIIVKPVDSSGSKGVGKVVSKDQLKQKLDYAFEYSRCGRIIIEEFVEKKHPYLIGGDVFVTDGKIVLWGLLNCHRDESVNPLVPVGKSYPLILSENDIKLVHGILQQIVDKLHIKQGAMNVELIVDKNGKVWPIDIGPRNGGNMIPDLLGLIFDVDVVEMSIRTAMGEKSDMHIKEEISFYATHNLHSNKNGTYKNIVFNDELEKYVVKKCLYKQAGDVVEFFDNASKALGIVFLKFNTMEKMVDTLNNITDYINIVLK